MSTGHVLRQAVVEEKGLAAEGARVVRRGDGAHSAHNATTTTSAFRLSASTTTGTTFSNACRRIGGRGGRGRRHTDDGMLLLLR